MVILAGRIGGTNSDLCLFEMSAGSVNGGSMRKLDEKTVATASYPSPEDMVVAFARARPQQVRIDAAAFGIAGPVHDGVCHHENFSSRHQVSEASLARGLDLSRVSLLNDLAAMANGVRFLRHDQLVTVQAGVPVERGTMVMIAFGEGLGEAALVWQGSDYEPLALEGGHTDLAVRNEEELELFQFLLTIERPVTQEAVLCGAGLYNIYRHLLSTGRYPDPAELRQQIDAADDRDKPALVSQFGLARRSAIYEKALDMFVSMFGARAGNLAMTFMATGGVFVAGDMASRNLRRLQDGTFKKAFADKGFFRQFMERLPVHVVLEEKTAVIGAAHYAAAHPT
jgi:glucokinase